MALSRLIYKRGTQHTEDFTKFLQKSARKKVFLFNFHTVRGAIFNGAQVYSKFQMKHIKKLT